MIIRYICASAAAAFGFACSSSSFARVVVAYAPATLVYVPPRPAYYYVPAPRPYATPVVLRAAVPVVVPPLAPRPLPLYQTVVVPPQTKYAIVPAAHVVYAQPVIVVPR